VLKKRVITASILAIVLIADTFLPMVEFALSMALIVALGAWEWANLAGLKKVWVKVSYVLVTLLFLVSVYRLPFDSVLWLASIFWLFAFAAIVFYPDSGKYWGHTICRMLMGLIALPIMWISFVLIHEEVNGAWLILILWAMVALADIGAYFVGHAMGSKKLAPHVSPGKTREGAYGGLLSAALISFSASYFYSHSFESSLWCAVIAISVAIATIIGDLFESMLKRFRGIKDSGNLLPGHGGVLDRIDGWVAAAPVYAFFVVKLNTMMF
jgi:phosphatidate cytidylyltransferase